MRTLAFLAALLLLAFQARAQPLWATADQVPTQNQPEAEDQDMAIASTEKERITRKASGLRKVQICTCQRTAQCKDTERPTQSCDVFGTGYKLCCH